MHRLNSFRNVKQHKQKTTYKYCGNQRLAVTSKQEAEMQGILSHFRNSNARTQAYKHICTYTYNEGGRQGLRQQSLHCLCS